MSKDRVTQVGFSCYFIDIEGYAQKHDFEITEHGPGLIGESFIVLKDDNGMTVSYIMDGCNGNGVPTYKCVYSDIE